LAESMAKEQGEKFKEAANRFGEAAMLLARAELNYNKRGSKKRAEARDFATEAMAICQDLDDGKPSTTRLLAMSTSVLCNIEILCRKPEEGLDKAQKAVDLYKALGDRKGQAKQLHMMGLALFLCDDLEGGIEAEQHAYDLFMELGCLKLAAFEKFIMAQYFLMRRRGREALPLAEDALVMFKELNFIGGGWQAHAVDALVQAYIMKGDETQAMQVAQEGLEYFQLRKDKRSEVVALGTLAHVHCTKQEPEEAMKWVEEAQAVIQDIGDTRWEAGILQDKASVHLMQKSFQEASQAANEAASVFADLKDRKQQAISINSLVSVALAQNDLRAAVQQANEQRAIFQEIGDRSREANVMLTLSGCYACEGHVEDAIGITINALEVFQDAKDKDGEARAHNFLSDYYVEKQDCELAIQEAYQMRSCCHDLGDRVSEADACRVLANICMNFDRHKEGLRAANEALALAKKAMDRKVMVEMMILVSQAWVSMSTSEGPKATEKGHDKSVRPAKEALQLARKLGNKVLLGSALFQLGNVHMLSAHVADAKRLAREAIDIFREIEDKVSEAAATILMAESHFVAAEEDAALDAANQAVALSEEIGDQKKAAHAHEIIERIQGRKVNLNQMPAGMPQQQMVAAGAVGDADAGAASATAAVAKKKGLDPEDVNNTVQEIAKAAIGVDDELYMDSALMDSGMDSLTAVSFRNSLQQAVGVKLPSSLMFDYPTMKEVANRIVQLSLDED